MRKVLLVFLIVGFVESGQAFVWELIQANAIKKNEKPISTAVQNGAKAVEDFVSGGAAGRARDAEFERQKAEVEAQKLKEKLRLQMELNDLEKKLSEAALKLAVNNQRLEGLDRELESISKSLKRLQLIDALLQNVSEFHALFFKALNEVNQLAEIETPEGNKLQVMTRALLDMSHVAEGKMDQEKINVFHSARTLLMLAEQASPGTQDDFLESLNFEHGESNVVEALQKLTENLNHEINSRKEQAEADRRGTFKNISDIEMESSNLKLDLELKRAELNALQ